jgi:hypothetical protein
MDEIDKRVRRSAFKLIASSLAHGFMVGLAVGAAVVYVRIDRVVVIPLAPSVEVSTACCCSTSLRFWAARAFVLQP